MQNSSNKLELIVTNQRQVDVLHSRGQRLQTQSAIET
jgi:hypothetical protein